MSDEEYTAITWVDMLDRIADALRAQEPLSPQERQGSDWDFEVLDLSGPLRVTRLVPPAAS